MAGFLGEANERDSFAKQIIDLSSGGVQDADMPSNGDVVKGQEEEIYKAQVSSARAVAFERRKRLPFLIQKGLSKPGRISFDVLRRASRAVHVVRICITVLKEKVTKTPWVIQSKDPRVKVDPEKLKKMTEFFQYPNQNNETFRSFLDKTLEDLLTLDAVAWEKTRYPDGTLAEIHYIDGACYSDDTEVLTKEGWKLFKDVDITKDLFATRDNTTKEFEWQKATYKHEKDWDGDFYNFKSKSLDIFVSPNHRMLVNWGPHDKKQQNKDLVYKAEELYSKYKSKGFIPATSKWKGIDKKTFVFKGSDHGNAKNYEFLAEDFVAFMGMYLAEGCYDRRGSSIYISQLKKSKGYEEYKELLTRMIGKEPYYGGSSWEFKNKPLRDYLSQFGYANDKFIPKEILELSPRLLNTFLHFYLLGDGCFADDRFTATTVSKKLADGLQELAQKIGMSAYVRNRGIPTKGKIGNRVIVGNYERLDISFRTSHYQRYDVEKKTYKGKIYCVSVPNEFLYVRRKGRPSWCGNTIRPIYDEHGQQDILLPFAREGGDPETLPVSYVQVVDDNPWGGREAGQPVAFWPKKDFIYFNMHPQGDLASFGYGMSPIESVIGCISNLLSADNFNSTYFEEGAFPPMLLQFKAKMGTRELEQLREYLRTELEGRFYRPAILAGAENIDVHNLKDITQKDMQFMNYMEYMSRLTAAAYGLKAQDIGLTDGENYATAKTQKEQMEQQGYGAILSLLKEVFNQQIIQKDFGFTDIEFDWVLTDSLDPEKANSIYDTSLKNGTMTVNEVRKKMNMLPYGDWADVPAILGGEGYLPIVPQHEDKPKEEKGHHTELGGDEVFRDESEAKDFSKSIVTRDGVYRCWADDRGVGQPFIFSNILEGTGYAVKPPAAVNMYSQRLEERITKKLSQLGLNVAPVVRMTETDIEDNILPTPEVRRQFKAYQNMEPQFDSEKWRQKFGGSRRFDYYMVSKFIEGKNLLDGLLIQDMKRVPNDYAQAVKDLAQLWLAEKKYLLGDRRADQVIITPDKRAWGIDFQFVNNESRWKSTKDAYAIALKQVPELYRLFMKLTGQTAMEKTKKLVGTLLSKASFQSPNASVQSFEDSPVLFGQLVADQKVRSKCVGLFADNDADEVTANGFTELMYAYTYEQALLALKEYVQANPSSYGGIVTKADIRGVKYVLYVSRHDSKPIEYQVNPNNPHA